MRWDETHTRLRACTLSLSEVVGAVFLDLKKASDLVNHNILTRKLSLYIANSPSVAFLKSYLELRPQTVYINGEYSTEGTIPVSYTHLTLPTRRTV